MKRMERAAIAVLMSLIVTGSSISAFCGPGDEGSPPAAAGEVKQAEDEGAVRFHRPYEKGDRFTLKAKLTITFDKRIGKNQNKQKMNFAEDLIWESSVRVIGVSEAGEPVTLMARVKKAVERVEGQDHPMSIEGGALGISAKGGQFEFNAKGQDQIHPAEVQTLQVIFGFLSGAIKPAGPSTTSDLFDPPGKVAEGETWKGDAEKIAGYVAMELAAQGIPVEADDVSCDLTFKGTETWDGLPCHRVVKRIVVTGIDIPDFTGDVELIQEDDVLLPVDAGLKKHRIQRTFHQKIKGRIVKQGQIADIVDDTLIEGEYIFE